MKTFAKMMRLTITAVMLFSTTLFAQTNPNKGLTCEVEDIFQSSKNVDDSFSTTYISRDVTGVADFYRHTYISTDKRYEITVEMLDSMEYDGTVFSAVLVTDLKTGSKFMSESETSIISISIFEGKTTTSATRRLNVDCKPRI